MDHICCWSKADPHRCISCCECGAMLISDFSVHINTPPRILPQEIAEALDIYRKKCPESYVGFSDTALICSVLQSAGFYGKMAAQALSEKLRLKSKLDRIRQIVEENTNGLN